MLAHQRASMLELAWQWNSVHSGCGSHPSAVDLPRPHVSEGDLHAAGLGGVCALLSTSSANGIGPASSYLKPTSKYRHALLYMCNWLTEVTSMIYKSCFHGSSPSVSRLILSQTPQQGAMLDNDQEGGTASSQWALYSLGRRDVPPDNIMKKVGALTVTSRFTQYFEIHTGCADMHDGFESG